METPDSRPYGHLESFYSEPPMQHQETYPEAAHAYEARDFHRAWTDFGHAHEPDAAPVPDAVPPVETHIESRPAPAEAVGVPDDEKLLSKKYAYVRPHTQAVALPRAVVTSSHGFM